MLDEKTRMIPERLGLNCQVDVVAEALPGFRPECVAVGLGGAEDAEAHARLCNRPAPACNRPVPERVFIARRDHRSSARSVLIVPSPSGSAGEPGGVRSAWPNDS